MPLMIAFKLYEDAANSDQADALYTLASWYANGRKIGPFSLKKDVEKANHMYSSAYAHYLTNAANGEAEAQYRLGVIRLDGFLTEYVELNRAIFWLTKAMEQDHLPARLRLAKYWMELNQQKSNGDKARKILKEIIYSQRTRSEDRDLIVEAQYQYALCNEQGIGGSVCLATAAIWYDAAAKALHQHSKFKLAEIYEKGIKQLKQTLVPQNLVLARDLYNELAKSGYPNAIDGYHRCENLLRLRSDGEQNQNSENKSEKETSQVNDTSLLRFSQEDQGIKSSGKPLDKEVGDQKKKTEAASKKDGKKSS